MHNTVAAVVCTTCSAIFFFFGLDQDVLAYPVHHMIGGTVLLVMIFWGLGFSHCCTTLMDQNLEYETGSYQGTEKYLRPATHGTNRPLLSH